MSDAPKKRSLTDRFLDVIDRACRKLPSAPFLMLLLFFITAIIGALLSWCDFSIVNPATQKVIVSQNFFSSNGINWLLKNMIKNFTGYAPLGLVLAMTIAIGLCEESGLLLVMLKRYLRGVSPNMMPFVIAFIGVLGNIASNTAMVVIPPLAAVVYIGVGKNPIVGMITGFAGSQAGFSANLIIAGTDSLLQGLTNSAIKGFLPETTFAVDVTCNWYFMVISTFVLSVVIGLVSIYIIEPRFPKYESSEGEGKLEELTPVQKKGMRDAGLGALAYLVLVAIGFFFGPLAKIAPDGSRLFVGSPLLNGLIPILFIFFSIPGLIYGHSTGVYKNTIDISKAMNRQMAAVASFTVFCFFGGQFNSLFNWTQLGTILAIKGANFLSAMNFTGIPMCVCFILMTTLVNLLIGSGSAKWAIFAPLFVPMFMLMGYHPGFTQLIYRIGDSSTNGIAPMSAYIWMMLGVAEAKYMKAVDSEMSIGTFIANLIPCCLATLVVWIIMFVIWAYFDLPIGPGVTAALPAGIL